VGPEPPADTTTRRKSCGTWSILLLWPHNASPRRHWVAAIQKMRSLGGHSSSSQAGSYRHGLDVSAHEFEAEVDLRFGGEQQQLPTMDRFGRNRSSGLWRDSRCALLGFTFRIE
jgi:hypothetical protein